jgi:hypothetical protein
MSSKTWTRHFLSLCMGRQIQANQEEVVDVIGLVVQWQDGPVGRYPSGFKSWCLHFFLNFPGFTGVMRYVVSDVLVDDEAPLVTSGISRSAGAQSFGGAHRGRVCVRVFIWVSVRVCCKRLRCTM